MAITFKSDVQFTCIIYRDPRNWKWKLSANAKCHNFWLECMIDAHDISRHSKLNTKALGKFEQPLLLTRMYDWRPWYIETLKIEQRKLSENSNGHNFRLECMIDTHYISKHLKSNNGSSLENQMAITFDSDVWLTCIIYRNTQNWTRKLYANANGHNFWLECMIDGHDILRRSKFNNGSSREMQMDVTL